MRGLFKNKPLIIMLVAVLLLGVLAFITSADRSVSWVESTLGSVFQPVQTFAAKASNSIIGFFQRIFKTSDADKELEQLQVRMAQLEQAADENATLKAENERLKKLLNYVETLENYDYVTAVVTGNSQGVWFETFTINAGRNKRRRACRQNNRSGCELEQGYRHNRRFKRSERYGGAHKGYRRCARRVQHGG